MKAAGERRQGLRRIAPFTILLAAVSCSEKPQPDPAVVAAQEKIRAMLRDPESAQFRKIVRYPKLVCGEVNAKNGFGGYDGFSQFSYDLATREAVIDEVNDEFGIALADTNCTTARFEEELRQMRAERATEAGS